MRIIRSLAAKYIFVLLPLATVCASTLQAQQSKIDWEQGFGIPAMLEGMQREMGGLQPRPVHLNDGRIHQEVKAIREMTEVAWNECRKNPLCDSGFSSLFLTPTWDYPWSDGIKRFYEGELTPLIRGTLRRTHGTLEDAEHHAWLLANNVHGGGSRVSIPGTLEDTLKILQSLCQRLDRVEIIQASPKDEARREMANKIIKIEQRIEQILRRAYPRSKTSNTSA